MRRLLAVLGLVLPLLALGTSAGAQAPVSVGWWTSLPLVAPDVGETDLLLQGGDPQRLAPEAVAAGVISTDPTPTALAALRFLLPADAAAGDLVLPVATGAQALDTRAYATADAWRPAQGGPASDAPQPDLGRYVLGALSDDGTQLVFPGAGKLATDGGELSVVLVAGATDRVVVHAPTDQALAVSGGGATAAPPVDVPPPPAPGPAALPPLAPVPGAPPLAPAPLPSTPVVVAPVAPAPVAAALPVSRPASVVRADDGRTRLVLLLEALLVTAFFGLLGTGPLAALARLTGQPDDAGTGERGVGRFRSVRVGRPPRV